MLEIRVPPPRRRRYTGVFYYRVHAVARRSFTVFLYIESVWNFNPRGIPPMMNVFRRIRHRGRLLQSRKMFRIQPENPVYHWIYNKTYFRFVRFIFLLLLLSANVQIRKIIHYDESADTWNNNYIRPVAIVELVICPKEKKKKFSTHW